MRYSVAATTALLATSSLSLALPTIPTTQSIFSSDSSLSLPAIAGKVFDSVNGWFGGVKDDAKIHWQGLKADRLVQDGVDCESPHMGVLH